MGGCEVAGSYWILIILKCLHSTAFFACMSDLGWCQLFQLFLCSVMHIKWTIWALRDVQFSISAAVQSGSAPAPWFSVITHFRTDTVRKSRLFWHERRKKNAAKRGTKKKNPRHSNPPCWKAKQIGAAGVVSYLSWNCLDGTKPARGLASPSILACHHVASSWLMMWRIEPFLKASPASLHGIALSSLGS